MPLTLLLDSPISLLKRLSPRGRTVGPIQRFSAVRRLVQLSLLAICVFLPWPSWAMDLNTASSDALQSLRGVGPRMAERILAERDRSPFVSLEDLAQRVRGVGPATVERLRAQGLTIGDGRHRPTPSQAPERPQSRLGPSVVVP